MADVKWIKIVTDIFDDEKVLLIESLPEADSLIVIWFKLLCLAGKQNNNGVFLMGEKIPYTEAMLATIFRRKETTVKLALKTFEQFGMIEIINGVITIPNWEKHQKLDQLEMIKEQTRKRVAKHRAKQKLLASGTEENEEIEDDENEDCNVTSNVSSNVTEDVTVTSSNADRLDKIRIDKNRLDKNKKETKNKYGFYKNVLLSKSEYQKLLDQYGEINLDNIIKYLDEYIEMKGAKYKSHYLVILKWGAEAALKEQAKENRNFFKDFLES